MPELHEQIDDRTSSEQAASIGAAAALRPYVAALRGHWRLIAAVTVLAFGGCLAWFQQKDSKYEAQAKVLVSPLPEDSTAFIGLPILRSSDDPGRLIDTAASIIESPIAAEQAGEELGVGRGGVEGSVGVTAEESANIVTVTAQSTDPEEAAAMANLYAEASLAARADALAPLFDTAIADLRTQIRSLSDQGALSAEQARRQLAELRVARNAGVDPTLAITQEAVVPGKPLGLPRYVILMIAVTGGFAIGSMAAVLIDLLTPRRISEEGDLKEIYPLPVLARIPEAGSGVSLGQSLAEIRESFRTLRGRLAFAPGRDPDTRGIGSIAVVSPSRGDGRTTATLNLARAIAAADDTAVAIDLDLRHPGLAAIAGHEPRSDLSTALLPGRDLGEAIEAISASVSIVAAPRDASAETIERAAGRAGSLIEDALAEADAVVIDTPAFSEASDALSVIASVDHIVIVVRLGQTSAADLARLQESIEVTGARASGYAVIGGSASRTIATERPRSELKEAARSAEPTA